MSNLYNYKAKIVRVVDGDTVDAMIDLGFSIHCKQRIRLYGINAPESRTRDKVEKAAGLAATARLKELLRGSKNECVVCTKLDKKGKYGRLLGSLYHPGMQTAGWELSINQKLINEGHALPYDDKQ